jgi:hypothetical protein
MLLLQLRFIADSSILRNSREYHVVVMGSGELLVPRLACVYEAHPLTCGLKAVLGKVASQVGPRNPLPSWRPATRLGSLHGRDLEIAS